MFSFEHQGTAYNYPTALSEISLGQRIAWQDQYGDALDARAAGLEALADDFTRELETTDLYVDTAIQTFSFYTGIPLTECARIEMVQILNLYGAVRPELAEQEAVIGNSEFQPLHSFKGELWRIAAPEVKPDSGITFNEFLISKEVVRQLHALGGNTWSALPYLCAVYLRKDGEPFSESLAQEGSERLNLMLELPMDTALHVAFFLASSITTYRNILASSAVAGAADPTWDSSSSGGAG